MIQPITYDQAVHFVRALTLQIYFRICILYHFLRMKYPKLRDRAPECAHAALDKLFRVDGVQYRLDRPRDAKESIRIVRCVARAYAFEEDENDVVITRTSMLDDAPSPKLFAEEEMDITDVIAEQWQPILDRDYVYLKFPIDEGFVEIEYDGHAMPSIRTPARRYSAVYKINSEAPTVKFPPCGAFPRRPDVVARVVEATLEGDDVTERVSALAGPNQDFYRTTRSALRWALGEPLGLVGVEFSDWKRCRF